MQQRLAQLLSSELADRPAEGGGRRGGAATAAPQQAAAAAATAAAGETKGARWHI